MLEQLQEFVSQTSQSFVLDCVDVCAQCGDWAAVACVVVWCCWGMMSSFLGCVVGWDGWMSLCVVTSHM